MKDSHLQIQCPHTATLRDSFALQQVVLQSLTLGCEKCISLEPGLWLLLQGVFLPPACSDSGNAKSGDPGLGHSSLMEPRGSEADNPSVPGQP